MRHLMVPFTFGKAGGHHPLAPHPNSSYKEGCTQTKKGGMISNQHLANRQTNLIISSFLLPFMKYSIYIFQP